MCFTKASYTSCRCLEGSLRFSHACFFNWYVFLQVWGKRWAVLKSTTHEGVVRLEYYDSQEESVTGANKRVILLRNSTGCCETMEYRKTRPYALQFSTRLGIYRYIGGQELHSISMISEIEHDVALKSSNMVAGLIHNDKAYQACNNVSDISLPVILSDNTEYK